MKKIFHSILLQIFPLPICLPQAKQLMDIFSTYQNNCTILLKQNYKNFANVPAPTINAFPAKHQIMQSKSQYLLLTAFRTPIAKTISPAVRSVLLIAKIITSTPTPPPSLLQSPQLFLREMKYNHRQRHFF